MGDGLRLSKGRRAGRKTSPRLTSARGRGNTPRRPRAEAAPSHASLIGNSKRSQTWTSKHTQADWLLRTQRSLRGPTFSTAEPSPLAGESPPGPSQDSKHQGPGPARLGLGASSGGRWTKSDVSKRGPRLSGARPRHSRFERLARRTTTNHPTCCNGTWGPRALCLKPDGWETARDGTN
jgi:hypothetical protein